MYNIYSLLIKSLEAYKNKPDENLPKILNAWCLSSIISNQVKNQEIQKANAYYQDYLVKKNRKLNYQKSLIWLHNFVTWHKQEIHAIINKIHISREEMDYALHKPRRKYAGCIASVI